MKSYAEELSRLHSSDEYTLYLIEIDGRGFLDFVKESFAFAFVIVMGYCIYLL